MSGKFGGFSQDEINRVATSTSTRNNKENDAKPTARRQSAPSKKTEPTKTTVPKPPKAAQPPPPPPSVPDISLSTTSSSTGDSSIHDALHFKPLQQHHQHQGSSSADNDARTVRGASENGGGGSSSRAQHPLGPVATATAPSSSGASNGHGVEQQLVQPLKGVSLRDFEAQRRAVEEQNKHKQAMLHKVIEQHSARTAAEAKKLANIRQDLAQLESDLAVDVSILRKQIDAASLRYMKANDHYTQVESVFLKAKLDLQKARETKDLLAEHLNLIIVSNEDRKANKLADLMSQVGLDSNGETAVKV